MTAPGPQPRGAILRALLLPVAVTLVIPALLLHGAGGLGARLDAAPSSAAAGWGAAVLAAVALVLMVRTMTLFATVGKGSLAPWAPTARLVVVGIYRHVRNPMITGVVCLLAAEALFFASTRLAVWAGAFCFMNLLWIPLWEEPDLRRRFGTDYDEYRRHVPRWIPRRTAWEGLAGDRASSGSEGS